MSELTDIDGVGPATADSFAEMGYESPEELTEAEPEELAEVSGVTEDSAREYILEARNMSEDSNEEEELADDEFDLTPSEVSDEVDTEASESDSEDVDEGDDPDPSEDDEADESSSQEAQSESEDDDPDPVESYPVSLDFENDLQGRTFHAAVMRRHENIYSSHQPSADALQKVLDAIQDFSSVSVSLTEHELNTLHSAVKNQRTAYQGDNLIEHMDALRAVEEQVNDIRREHLF